MRWKGRRQSSNFEDRRGGSRGGRRMAGGGGGALGGILSMLMSRTGWKGKLILLAIMIGASFFGLNLGGSGGLGLSSDSQTQTGDYKGSAAEEQMKAFSRTVLADTETIWKDLYPKHFNQPYTPTTMVLYTGSTRTGCGQGSSTMGPFYCPARGDNKVYIDLSFFSELRRRFGAPGDFAQAYVIAHEVAHHIQTLSGTSSKLHRMKQNASKVRQNQLTVYQELQADCYSGVWAYHIGKKGYLENGDIEEAMNAARAIGDDTLQRNAGQRINVDAFTHGSAKQRMRWFKRGMRRGNPDDCDTLSYDYNEL